VDLTALMPKIGDRVETIGLHLAKGNFEKAAKLARELRHDEVMKDVLEKGHKLMGTSLVIVASGSFGGGTPNLGAGISSYVGIAINLGDGGPGAAVFLSSGGSLSGGVSNSTGNSLSAVVGVAVGLVKGDPTNAGGFCLDGGASVTAAGVTRTLSLCFPFTADKPPGSPTMFTVGVAAEIQSFDPKALGANISVGASYTHIVQRIK
jgi:hypothetical protein